MTHRLSTLLLALLLCLCCIPAAQAQGEAALTLSSSAGSGYGGDEITVSLALTAENLGGLQTSLIWNSGYLTYVEGSAAFSSAFTSRISVPGMGPMANAPSSTGRLLRSSL